MAVTAPSRRITGVLALEPAAFRAVADDEGALGGALVTVVGATLLAGIGGLLWTQWGGHPPANATFEIDVRRFIARSVLLGTVAQTGAWLLWVGVTYLYLRAFGERVNGARLARVMGYAFAPMGIQLFIAPPGMEIAAAAVAFGYTAAAMIIGVEAGTGAARGRVVLSVLVGLALFATALGLLGNGTGDLAPGIFALDPLPTSVGIVPLRR
jgi:hypothetical protein